MEVVQILSSPRSYATVASHVSLYHITLLSPALALMLHVSHQEDMNNSTFPLSLLHEGASVARLFHCQITPWHYWQGLNLTEGPNPTTLQTAPGGGGSRACGSDTKWAEWKDALGPPNSAFLQARRRQGRGQVRRPHAILLLRLADAVCCRVPVVSADEGQGT